MDTIQGTIIIKILKANLSRDTEVLGKMAPYCLISVNNLKSKTTVKKNYGKTPEWFETFSFVAKIGDEVNLKVWDKDAVTADDLVGEGTLTVKKEHINMKYCFWVPLQFKNKNSGQIQIDIEFIPNNKSLDILIGLLGNEFKEKVSLLNKIEKKSDGGEVNVNLEMLSSKGDTSRKIQELNEQIKQLKVEFQTKKDEIQKQSEISSKANEDLKKNLNELQKELADYSSEVKKGTLQISLLNGNFTRDVGGMFDKMDPFVLFGLGTNTVQSNVKKDSGKKVEWNQNLELQRISQEELAIYVLDYQDNLSHRTIGYTFISVKECIHSKNPIKFSGLKIYYKDEDAGEINLAIKFIPDQ